MLVLIGTLIGLILGLTGAGGSVFAVPLLMLTAGFSINTATGISLGAVAASTLYGSLLTLMRKRGKDKILWLPGAILAITGALTAPVGKWLAMQIPEAWLLVGFSGLVAIIAVRMWLGAQNPDAAKVVRASNFADTPTPELLCNLSNTGQFELRPGCLSGLITGGVLVGLLSGLFGVGGGFLIVPLLLLLSPITMAQAVSTSLLIIAAVSCSGFISHLVMAPYKDWSLLGLVTGGGILGMMIGQMISHRIANAFLQKIFAISLLLLGSVTLLRHFL